jgi:hypothetical protein
VKHLVIPPTRPDRSRRLTRSVDIYHAYPRNQSRHDDGKNSSTAILFLTDFYGIALINNNGKHVARFMTSGKGIDLGFVAHPANLTDEEIQAIARPISVAAGGMFTSYPATTFSGHERAGADSCRTR